MKISIITVCYNSASTISDTLASVLSQQYAQIEHVLVDGGSTDETAQLINSYKAQVVEKNKHKNTANTVVFLSEKDNGIYDAMNKGIRLATGDVIGFLNSDDIYATQDVISEMAEIFENQKADIVYGNLQYVKKEDLNSVIRYWKSGDFSLSKIQWGWMPPHPTFYAKKELFGKYGGFDLSYKISADYDIMIRFLLKSVKVVYIPKVLIKMRVGGQSNQTIPTLFKKTKEDYQIMKKNKVGGLLAVCYKKISKLTQYRY